MLKSFFLILLLLLITTCLVNAALMAHWNFDDAKGSVASNSLGGLQGNLIGLLWTTGKVHVGLFFDGVDDRVDSDKLNVWINGVSEVSNFAEADLIAPVFDGSTTCGMRLQSANVSPEYDNFKFFDEYE